MATITYQCNTCKRVITKQENPIGLTVFGKCVITQNCLGKLYTLSRNIDSNREVFPKEVDGLLDYSPRKAFFNFTQTLPANVWPIKHNLSTFPAVTVYTPDSSGNLNPLDPTNFNISIVDKDNIKLIFNQPLTGTAQCISRSTTTSMSTAPTTSTQIQVTINGLITLAIPQTIINTPPFPNIDMSNLTFNLQVDVTQPSQQEQSSLEYIPAETNVASPWNDWPHILVKKRKNYIVRTKNIFNFLAFGQNANTTSISNGTQLRFSQILFPNTTLTPIPARTLLFLLSNAPYASIDKVRNKIIDVGEMIDTQIDYFTYQNGELYVDSSVIENSYPDIVKVMT